MKGLSNEVLALLAQTGNERAKIELYENVKRLWMKKCPVDVSGMYNFEDWMSLCKEEFFLSLEEYDINRAKFSTYIFMRIRNRISNEQGMLSAQKRQRDLSMVGIDDSVGIENLFYEEFYAYQDADFVQFYIERFRKYLGVSGQMVLVFDLLVKYPEYGLKKLSIISGLHRKVLEQIIERLKELFLVYVRNEMRGGYEISCQ